jgi:hypothetical protein
LSQTGSKLLGSVLVPTTTSNKEKKIPLPATWIIIFLAKKWWFERILSGDWGSSGDLLPLVRSIRGGCPWCLTFGQLYDGGAIFWMRSSYHHWKNKLLLTRMVREQRIWNRMCGCFGPYALDLLAQINPGIQIPVWAQLLGLLPILNDSGGRWPDRFQLEQYAAWLQHKSASIRMSKKSPFVWI